MSNAINDVIAERVRQEGIGWSAKHDDYEHKNGELADAGAFYALARGHHQSITRTTICGGTRGTDPVWPSDWTYKPKGRRADLVRAAALIIAEIERLDRIEKAP